jgi:hypothetical protein
MSKKRGNCKKYGRSTSTGKCRARPSPGRRGSKIHRRGKKAGGQFKVSCQGKRVYASGSESSAKAAAASASKRMKHCTVFTKTSRIATFEHGTQR